MKILLTLLVFSFTQLSFAQSEQIEKADDLFNRFNYEKAISCYQKLINDGEHIYYCSKMIAKAYSKLKISSEAIHWYKKCVEYPEIEHKIYLLLAHELLRVGEQNEASVNFHKYYTSSNTPHQLTASSFIDYYNSLFTDSMRYNVITLTINSKYDEFGPALYGDNMVFTSNRPLKSISKRHDVQTGKSFFNLFKVDKTSSNPSLFSKELQTKFNDGPVCFSKDNKTIYITRNTSFETKHINTLDIFVSQFKDDKWTKEVKRLPIRKGNYTIAHANLSADNKQLFFSSNMPGGFGGMDLYVCEIKNGFISQPINLGSSVNTTGNEVFPFLATNGTLYFSSDMHPGLGGYDLFFSKKINDKYSIPFNLGYPANTSGDDFSLILDKSNQFGFFASNRTGGGGGDDIYAIKINHPLDYCIIEAQVFDDADSTMLNQAFISITDAETQQKVYIKTDKNGKFHYYLKKDKKYLFEVKRKLYTDFKGVLTPEDLKTYDVLKLNIGMKEK